MKKAQMPLKVIMSFALTMVLFGSSALFAGKYFGLSDDAFDDYKALVEKVEEVGAAEIGSIEYVPQLTMDKESAIIAFPKNSEAFWIVTEGYGKWIKFEKPERLDKEKAYICICKDTEKDQLGKAWSCKEQMTCEETTVTFSETKAATKKQIGGYSASGPSDIPTEEGVYWIGFILLRAKAASYLGDYGISSIDDKTRTVYLEKINDGEVALCKNLVEGHCSLK